MINFLAIKKNFTTYRKYFIIDNNKHGI